MLRMRTLVDLAALVENFMIGRIPTLNRASPGC